MKLHPYQEEGVRLLASTNHCLLADDMGLGKTAQAIRALDAIGAVRAVIVCPSAVKINWVRQFHKWSQKQRNIYVVKSGSALIPPTADIIIVNYELIIRPKIKNQLCAKGVASGYDAVIIDEARALKTLTTKRTKAILGRKSFMHHAKYKWLLDGTPIPNRPLELYPILRTLAPECIDPYLSYEDFGAYFCRGRRDMFGWNMKGSSNAEELAERMKPFMLRRTKDEVLKQLPGKVETVVELETDTDPITVEDGFVSTVRRELGIAKIPAGVRFILDTLTQVEKLVIFAHHRDVILTLREKLLHVGAVTVFGGMSADAKQDAIDSFINDPNTQVIILQTHAGGTGIDGLQGVCSHCVFFEPDWSPGVMDQAIDRLRRIGQRNTVFVWHLEVAGSLDGDIQRQLKRKRTVIDKLMKGTKPMSLEHHLDRIATALEALVVAAKDADDIQPAPVAKPEVKQDVEPVAEKPKGKAKKAAPEPEPEPEIEMEAEAPAAAAPTTLTEEALREMASKFILAAGSTEDKKLAQQAILTKILPTYGATALAELDPSNYQAFADALSKGPKHYN